MALDADRLKTALTPEIESQMRSLLTLGGTPYPQLSNFAEALATAIANKVVEEIIDNAEVKVSGTIYPDISGTGTPNGYLLEDNSTGSIE